MGHKAQRIGETKTSGRDVLRLRDESAAKGAV